MTITISHRPECSLYGTDERHGRCAPCNTSVAISAIEQVIAYREAMHVEGRCGRGCPWAIYGCQDAYRPVTR